MRTASEWRAPVFALTALAGSALLCGEPANASAITVHDRPFITNAIGYTGFEEVSGDCVWMWWSGTVCSPFMSPYFPGGIYNHGGVALEQWSPTGSTSSFAFPLVGGRGYRATAMDRTRIWRPHNTFRSIQFRTSARPNAGWQSMTGWWWLEGADGQWQSGSVALPFPADKANFWFGLSGFEARNFYFWVTGDWNGRPNNPYAAAPETPYHAYWNYAWIDEISLGAAVPEPTVWTLLFAGFGMAGSVARRQRQRSSATVHRA